ncbi:MAG: hypothetical protein KGJ41_16295 [Rhodospirillales bacterium]|nr:hypothetical protein [Rhodospirillales bacterium]MDE2200573.1 hypothetical protein [Rhodospirillales bacterium]
MSSSRNLPFRPRALRKLLVATSALALLGLGGCVYYPDGYYGGGYYGPAYGYAAPAPGVYVGGGWWHGGWGHEGHGWGHWR